MHNVLIINEADNVAVAVEDISQHHQVVLPDGQCFSALSDIPYGHKVALCDIAEGAEVIKYGEPITNMKVTVKQGEWIHVHNILTDIGTEAEL
jgi:altronate hydrolase